MPVAATILEYKHLLVFDVQRLHGVKSSVGEGAVDGVFLGDGPRPSCGSVIDNVTRVEGPGTSDTQGESAVMR